MLTSTQPLDWARLSYVGSRITWTAATYQHLRSKLAVSSDPTKSGTEWYRLPFEPVQLDKLPTRSGIYAFAYTYLCLGFPEQEIILYVGEAGNLQNRFKGYFREREKELGDIGVDNPPKSHEERLRLMFSWYQNLNVLFCTPSIALKQRRELERNLISLLDPPFNWNHRVKPKTRPIIDRLGPISVTPLPKRAAFPS